MFRGFATGSLALIALYVIVQPGASDRAGQASSWLQQGMRRWLASDVAGVPDRTKKSRPASTPAAGGRYFT